MIVTRNGKIIFQLTPRPPLVLKITFLLYLRSPLVMKNLVLPNPITLQKYYVLTDPLSDLLDDQLKSDHIGP